MNSSGKLPRRVFTKAALGTAAALAALSVTAATGFAEGTVTIASWGGSYQDAQSKALFEPAAKSTGIEVKP